MPKPGETGFARIYSATRYSWQGLTATWENESAFRQECVLAAVLTPVAGLLAENVSQWILLIAVMAVVLITELLNSAVESVVDRVGDEMHELSGRAKDQGSAAVFVSLSLAVFVWSSIVVANFLI